MIGNIEKWATPGPRMTGLADPAFRFLTSLTFIIGGFGHFGQDSWMHDRMKESAWWPAINMIGDPSWILWQSGAAFVEGALRWHWDG